MTRLSYRLLAVLVGMFSAHLAAAQSGTPNPKFSYLQGNQPVAPWVVAVGNESNWYVPITEEAGETSDGDLKVKKAKSDDGKEAIKLKFKGKKGIASLSLSGEAIDLSGIEDKVALAFDIKVDSRIKNSLSVSMGCKHPCKGTVQLRQMLNQQPRGEWATLPIPLNCFSKNGADLSKIDSPFMLESSGKLKLSIANIGLMRLGEGDKGCKKDS